MQSINVSIPCTLEEYCVQQVVENVHLYCLDLTGFWPLALAALAVH